MARRQGIDEVNTNFIKLILLFFLFHQFLKIGVRYVLVFIIGLELL